MDQQKIDYSSVRAFVSHGFQPMGRTEDQVYGVCPFCQKNKFYVNTESNAWDCKTCGKHGGFRTFLDEINTKCKSYSLRNEEIKELSKSRGIDQETFYQYDIGFNPVTKSYTIPIYGMNGSGLIDLRTYRTDSRIMSTATCHTWLWNCRSLDNLASGSTVYICEGEWDGMALSSVIAKQSAEVAVVAVPGAGTFKAEWSPWFRDKKVIALYDNDDAGRAGTLKCYNMLQSSAKSLQFLHWPKGKKDGYDIRDLCIEKKFDTSVVMDFIKCNLKPEPAGDTSKISSSSSGGTGAPAIIKYTGQGVPADEIRATYRKWLHIPDTTIIDVLYGTMFANRLQGDPLWLFVVAPPGMTKTELLQPFTEAKGIEVTSTVTAHTLVSGASLAGGFDPSLVPRLNGKVLIIKDFTTILNMNQQEREEIFGVLRDAYDGECTKNFGNGIRRSYKSRFGVVAGVTPVIETALEGESALGERFLRWEEKLPDIGKQMEYISKAMDNVESEDALRAELREAAARCLDYDAVEDVGKVEVSRGIDEKIKNMAIITAMLRGSVPRDKYTREIVNVPCVEIGTRLAKQLKKSLIGICMFRRINVATENELHIVKRLANSTAPGRVSAIVRAILTYWKDTIFSCKDIAGKIHLPNATAQRQIENLVYLGVLTREENTELKIRYKMNNDFLGMVKRSGIYQNEVKTT